MDKANSRFDSWKFRITQALLLFICRLLMKSWRVRIVGMEHREGAASQNPDGSFIIATFHENAIGGVLSHPNQSIAVLCSQSKDGELVAYVAENIGLRAVRGSSSRGGKEARDELIAHLRLGVSGAVTIDGPRGPRRKSKPGIVDIARKSGALILPTTCISDRSWILSKTWDKTRIPKPFAKLLVYYGEPIFVSVQCEGQIFEQFCHLVEQRLILNDDAAHANLANLWSKGSRFPK